MKLSRMALAAAIYCAVYAGSANAEGLRQPGSVVQVNHNYYDDQASPSDVPAPEAPAAVEPAAPVYEEAVEEEEDPRWYLFNQDHSSGLKAYGWINGGIFANSHGTNSRYNGPITFADRSDGQLNQLYGVLEKPIDTSEKTFDIGGRFDVLYGTDWIYNTEVGWETNTGGALLSKWNDSPYYGVVTPQMYGEFGWNDLSVKVGRFYTPIGYEVVTAPNNFFATHAYTMQYGEPFSHTGMLATWKASDRWTLIGGAVNGWDRFDGVSDRVAGMGGATYTPDHGKYTITLIGISGSEPTVANATQFSTRNLYSLVFNYTVSEKVNYVLQHDHGWQDNTLAVAGGGTQDAEWYGLNQYLFYTINDCWKAGIRAEWFRDDDGARVGGVRPTSKDGTDTGNDVATGTGFAGNFYDIAVGLNWTPTHNLIVRPEVRYDWYGGDPNAGGALPFGDGTRGSQFVYGLDAIFLW